MGSVRFEQDFKVTIQALGWRSGGRYLPNQDDIASVAYWYQSEPHGKFPVLPDIRSNAINRHTICFARPFPHTLQDIDLHPNLG